MTEFLHNLMHPLPNAVMTIIMGVIFLYWLVVFFMGVGLDDLDLGFDFDVDTADADIDGEIDASDTNTEKSPGFFINFLNFINVGKVPFMLIFSTLKFFIWIGTLITTHFINVASWGAFSLLILIPLAILAVFCTKFATNPLVKFFKEIGYKGEDRIEFLGRSGKMLSSIKENKIGTAEIVVDKNPIVLNVKSKDGSEIKYGDYIVVVDESDDKKIYFVEKEISIRNL